MNKETLTIKLINIIIYYLEKLRSYLMGRPKMSDVEKLAAREKRQLAVIEENKAIVHLNDNSEVVQRVKDNTLPVHVELKPEMKSIAFGVAQDPVTGNFFAVKIMFDLVSGATSEPIKLGQGDIRAIARERMLIDQANTIFGDQ